MPCDKSLLVYAGIASVITVFCAAIPNEMLGRRQGMLAIQPGITLALHTRHKRASIMLNQLWIAGIAFVSSTPAQVVHQRDAAHRDAVEARDDDATWRVTLGHPDAGAVTARRLSRAGIVAYSGTGARVIG